MYSVDKQDRVVELKDVPPSSAGAPCPILICDERRTLLAYLVQEKPYVFDGRVLTDAGGYDLRRNITKRWIGSHLDMYQKLSREKLESTSREYWFEELARHIAPQAESLPFVTDVDLVANLPREARAIYFLWMFACEVGGNGIECFILQQQGLFTPQIHEALQLVGATELVERLEAAIPHAIGWAAEFTFGPDMAWFRQFAHNARYPTLRAVDIGIWNFVEDDLVQQVNDFIEKNKAILVA